MSWSDAVGNIFPKTPPAIFAPGPKDIPPYILLCIKSCIVFALSPPICASDSLLSWFCCCSYAANSGPPWTKNPCSVKELYASMLAGSPFMYCSTCIVPVLGFTNVTNVDSDPAGVGAAVCVCSNACALGFKFWL